MRLAAQRPGIKKSPCGQITANMGVRMASNQGHLCQTLLFCVRLYCFVSDFIVCPQENYFFRLEAISAYLKQIFSDHMDQNFFNDLDARFHKILGFAAIYSLAIRHIQALSRSGTVITRDHLVLENDRYLATIDFETALSARGLQLPVEFSGFINLNIDRYLPQHQDQEPSRRLAMAI